MYEPDMFIPSFDVETSEATQLKGKQQVEDEQPQPLKEVKQAIESHIRFLLGIYKHRSVARTQSEYEELFEQHSDEDFVHFAKRVLASLNDIIPGLRCVKLAQNMIAAGVGELSEQVERENDHIQKLLRQRQEEQNVH